jgi:ribosome modulation factor
LPFWEDRAVYDRTKVLDEGMQAGLDDLPQESCPYPAGASEHVIWREGWRCATDDLSLPDTSEAVLDLEALPQTSPTDT